MTARESLRLEGKKRNERKWFATYVTAPRGKSRAHEAANGQIDGLGQFFEQPGELQEVDETHASNILSFCALRTYRGHMSTIDRQIPHDTPTPVTQ